MVGTYGSCVRLSHPIVTTMRLRVKHAMTRRRAGKIFMGNWEKIFAQLEKKLRATAEKTIGNVWRNHGQRFPLRPATESSPTGNVFQDI